MGGMASSLLRNMAIELQRKSCGQEKYISNLNALITSEELRSEEKLAKRKER